MSFKQIFAALVFASATPAMAATLDFTADNAQAGTILGTTWKASTRAGGTLTNATHKNDVGCTGNGWDFACDGTGPYDVGFGINGRGSNNNEIDGLIPGADEFVVIRFGETLRVTGFAGMLTYANTSLSGDREQVELQYKDGSNTGWTSVYADPLFIVNEGTGSFDTVGLAFRNDINVLADRVRFRADGKGKSDDGSFNVTAVGLELAAVPVPASLPLLLAGMGLFGMAARRKKKNAA